MHRKSLEAAEHIRKHDDDYMDDSSNNFDSSMNMRCLSPTQTPQAVLDDSLCQQNQIKKKFSGQLDSPDEKQLPESPKHKLKSKESDLKTESVANLRAKAKEHSAKLMEGINTNMSETLDEFNERVVNLIKCEKSPVNAERNEAKLASSDSLENL